MGHIIPDRKFIPFKFRWKRIAPPINVYEAFIFVGEPSDAILFIDDIEQCFYKHTGMKIGDKDIFERHPF
jgi:hypothetical protein